MGRRHSFLPRVVYLRKNYGISYEFINPPVPMRRLSSVGYDVAPRALREVRLLAPHMAPGRHPTSRPPKYRPAGGPIVFFHYAIFEHPDASHAILFPPKAPRRSRPVPAF